MTMTRRIFDHQIANTQFSALIVLTYWNMYSSFENRQQIFLTSWSVELRPNSKYFDCLHHVTETS